MVRAETEVSATIRKYPKLTPEWTWKFRLLEAEILNLQGLSPSVLSKIGPDFPLSFEDSELGIRRHMLLGLAYARVGNFAESEQNIATAEKNCAAINCESDGEIARARGASEVRKANLPAADAAFRKSLQIARQKRDRLLEAKDLLNLGVVASRDSRYDDAIDWSNAAAKRFHSLGSELDESKIAGNMGWIYFKLGDYSQALAMTSQAQSQAHKLHAVLDEIAWLANLGQIYFQIGQSTLAEDYYRRALQLAEESENTDLRFQVLTAFAFVSVQLGHSDAAQQYKDKAYELAHKENDRSAELFPLLIGGQLAVLNRRYSEAEQLFTEVVRDKQSIVSLRWQAQNELARLHEIQNQIPRADQEYREALSTVICARATLAHEESRLPFQANAAHIYDDYIRFLVEHGRSDQALQVADYGRSMTLMEGLGITKEKDCKFAPHMTTRPALAAQKSNSTILFYWLGHKESYLWAINRQNTSLFKLPSSNEIEAAVSHYRKLVLGPNDLLQSKTDPTNDLYQMLVAPAARYLSKTPRVTIIPDQELNNLNFETLTVSGATPHFWIEDATVAYASSLK
ncbi:MAG TPA: tetratricopeptide repeat protein, partial [Terriglobales bacterium]|nr:tetratricopeptide repeat protein [Terriglobales bacterium]